MKKDLYEAAISGNKQVLNETGVLARVASEVTPGRNTVLHIAAYHGCLEFFQELINLSKYDSAFLKAKNVLGNTALHEAAFGGNREVVNVLLQSCPELTNEINEAGERALFKACEGGHAKIAEVLCPTPPKSMEYYKRTDGQTPLHLAVSKVNTGLVEVLLRHKPELVTEEDNFHRIPLHMAALFQFPVGIIPSFSRDRKKLPLIGEMLLKNNEDGLSCYKVDANKQCALHIAVKEGNADLVKVILKYSSDCIEMIDNDGRNALHLAVNYATQIFDRVGGDDLKAIISSVMSERLINCIDNNGQTAFDIALQKGKEDPRLYRSIIGYLHKRGAIKKLTGPGSGTIPSIKAKTWRPDIISVSAVLIATVAFAAAFTLPGGIDGRGQGPLAPILINKFLFKLFVIFDTLAFCYSIGSAILLNFACFASQIEDPVITEISSNALWIALVSLSLTFGAAIHLVVASECLWLAVVVWVMVCILPIWIRAMSIAGKGHLFPRDRYVLLEGCNLVYSILKSIAWVAWVVFFFGLIHPSFCWVRKKIYEINLWKKLQDIESRI